MGVIRSSGDYLGAPRGATKIHPGDTVILYGRDPAIEALDERRRGFQGDVEHNEAVEKQQQMEQAEEQREAEQTES